MRVSELIDAFRPAEGPPPQTLMAFLRWCLSGAWPALIAAAAISCLAGGIEALTALILGAVVDIAVSSAPGELFSGSNVVILIAGVAFFVLARPLLFGLSATANSVVVAPNVNALVTSRLHRWTLGQSVQFFDDDFAGRIAQKQMQAASAVTNVAVESINVVAFALASLVGSLALLTWINGWVTAIFLAWLLAYQLYSK